VSGGALLVAARALVTVPAITRHQRKECVIFTEQVHILAPLHFASNHGYFIPFAIIIPRRCGTALHSPLSFYNAYLGEV